MRGGLYYYGMQFYKKAKRNTFGFTFVETLIYMTLVGVALSTFISFGLNAASLRIKNKAISEVNAGGRMMMEVMVKKIESAKIISTPNKGGSQEGLIVFKDHEDVERNFILDQGLVYFTEGIGQRIPITSSGLRVNSLNFINLGEAGMGDLIRIEADVSFLNHGNNDTSSHYQRKISAVALLR